MAAGDFSASALLNIRAKAENIWADSRLAQDFKANAQAAVAVKKNSNAVISGLTDPDKDTSVAITWVNPCAVAVQDCTTDCTISGPETEVATQTVTLDLCKEVGFNIDREKLRTNDYDREGVAATLMAQAVKALDEWWSQQILVKLHAFEGINVDAAPWTYAAGTTSIPAAQYNLSAVPEMLKDAILNKLGDPYFIDNGALYTAYLQAALNANNLDGKGDKARADALNMYFDMFNFAAAGISDTTFAISKSAVAFTTKTRYSAKPVTIGGQVQQIRYTVPSSVIPGVFYDVLYGITCTTVGGVAHVLDSWKVKTQGGIFLNPKGCPVTVNATVYNPTGVLSYTKV